MTAAGVRYGFRFDASACAGCKACQIACKDKHGLEVGRLWRRVYEVTGGGWRRSGAAWVPDVFAFHLSVACNHCARPICVEVCPSRALRQRDDGIVLLDTDRCLGCSYCEWSCPYGALQYDASRGCMTKCTFCVDEIDAGRPPVCVTSCPLRVLEYGDAEGGRTPGGGGATQHPLPDPRLTEPVLTLREHRDAGRARAEAVEVVPGRRHELREWSLVAFTLLAQLAAGMVVVAGAARLTGTDLELRGGLLWWAAGLAIAVALALSLRHLGAPRRALLAATHWRSSWLSREILAGVALAVVCATGALLSVTGGGQQGLLWPAGLGALALLASMSGVYMLRTVPTWNSLRTPAAFLATSLVLGSLATVVLHRLRGGGSETSGWLLGVALAALLVGRLAGFSARGWRPGVLGWLSFAGGGLLAGAILARETDATVDALLVLACAVVLAGEVVARHRFFESYSRAGI